MSRPNHAFTPMDKATALRGRSFAAKYRYGGSGEGRSQANVIKSTGREQVATPQRLISLACVVRKDERRIRAIDARGGPNALYGPPSQNDEDMGARKGELGLCLAAPGGTFRPSITADSNVIAVTSANGLDRSTRLFGPMVCLTQSNPADKTGQSQISIAIEGVQTIYNSGCEPIQVGESLYVDPNPYLIKDDSGNLINAILPPDGIPDTKQKFQIRSFNAAGLHAFTQSLYRSMLIRIQSKEFKNRLLKVTTDTEYVSLLQKTCDYVLDTEKNIAADMPIRGLLPMYTAFRMFQQFKIKSFMETDPSKPEPEQRMALYIMAMRGLIHMIKEDESRFSEVNRDYEATLPHLSDTPRPSYSAEYSIHSKEFSDLLVWPATNGQTLQENLMEAEGRLAMFAYDRMSVAMHRQRQYIATFSAGIALGSAAKGAQLDILLGRTQ